MRKTIYTGKLPKSKRRNEKSFWVFFYYYELTRQERNYNYFFGFLKVFQARKRKEISKQEREKLFTRESSQQAKEEREIFLGFLLSLQLNKLKVKLELIFFGFFLRLIKHTRRKRKEEIKCHG